MFTKPVDDRDNRWVRVYADDTTILPFTQVYSEELFPH